MDVQTSKSAFAAAGSVTITLSCYTYGHCRWCQRASQLPVYLQNKRSFGTINSGRLQK